MDDGTRISWLIPVILLMLCAVFFAVSETAFASVSKNRLKTLADKGNARAVKALYITDNFEQAITTILICTNLTHIAAATLVTVNVTKIWGVRAVTLSTVIMTLAVFFFAEMLPKSIAKKYSTRISLSSASVLKLFMTVFSPFAAMLTWIGNGVAALTPGDPQVSVTEDELYDIIEDMTEQGALDEEQGELISSAIQFQETTVESIMTARVDVAAIDVNTPQDEVLQIIKSLNHSRLPVYEGSIDHIIGILQIRKYIRTYLHEGAIKDIRSLLDKPLFVHQSAKIDDVLATMTKEKLNIAVVNDNYGGTFGIVSVEDILEELVGEIWDEDDYAEEEIKHISENVLSVSSETAVTDVLDELDIDISEDEKEDIFNKLMSELTYEHFAAIPKEGDSFEDLNMKVTVITMKGNRIIRLKVKKKKTETEVKA